jgi:hypothetical protein
MFTPTSRYADIETAELELRPGQPVRYVRRRFVPPPERFELVAEHVVAEGDRLDNLSNTYLADPEQFWRVADANGAMRPDELTETIDRRLRICQPEGLPGVGNG